MAFSKYGIASSKRSAQASESPNAQCTTGSAGFSSSANSKLRQCVIVGAPCQQRAAVGKAALRILRVELDALPGERNRFGEPLFLGFLFEIDHTEHDRVGQRRVRLR